MEDTAWPKYFKKRLILENPESTVGVATLWMPKENVAEYLHPKTYAVCGQLYTKQGINFILRNILANPKIQNLFLCGIDRQESGEALAKFFKNGVEEAPGGKWQIKGDSKALIDKEIPLKYLNLVRKKVTLHDMRPASLEELAEKVAQVHKQTHNNSPFCSPQDFPEPKKEQVEIYPSDHSVFKIRRKYIGDAWLDALKIINRFGREIPGMYGPVKQVANLSIVIEAEDPDSPEIYDYFNFDKKQLDLYTKGFFSKNETNSEVYTYGERIFNWDGVDQAKIMIEKLLRFKYDRGALAVLWKPHKDNFPPKGEERQELGQTKKWRVPCLVMILGQVVEGTFDMTAVFRNNDIYGAWPLNAFALRAFQKDIAKKISCKLGTLTTISHIAEIYELNFEEARQIVTEKDSLARTCQYDPRGYYSIEVVEGKIAVTFYSPDGSRELARYEMDGTKPKAGRDICAQVLKDMLISELGAAMDFGRQIAKAETAVKLGLKFEQDQLLQKKVTNKGSFLLS